jgi:uncharacterized protein DUF4242
VEQYLVELYLPRRDEAALADAAMRARIASEQVTSEGKHVRYLRTIFVPQDEICFHLYEAQAADVVGEAIRRAQIPYDRIVRAVSVDRTASHPTMRERSGSSILGPSDEEQT